MSICLNLKTTLVCFSSGSKYDVSFPTTLHNISATMGQRQHFFFTSTTVQIFCVICPDYIADISQIQWLTAVTLSRALL